jgi:hypothetical protein
MKLTAKHKNRPEQKPGAEKVHLPLYSRKLHILVLLANTSWVTSFTILPFAFEDKVWYHLASRTFPAEYILRSEWCSEEGRRALGELDGRGKGITAGLRAVEAGKRTLP